jgi:hypothetical protein
MVEVTMRHALTEDALERAGFSAGAYPDLAHYEAGGVYALDRARAEKLAAAGFLDITADRYVEPRRDRQAAQQRRATDAPQAGDQPAPAAQQPAGQRQAPAASPAPRAAAKKGR